MSSSPDFSWKQYLDLAQELAHSPGAGEAHLRTAISRAYYAAFHVAMGLLVSEGFIPSGTGQDHHKVWQRYRTGRGTGPERKQIASRGYGLYDDRRKADYRNPFGEDNIHEKAELALESARYIVDWVGRVRARRSGGS